MSERKEPTPERYEELIDRFEGLPVAVVGDIVADIYIYGKPSKLSREAPVMIVQFEEERLIPGSAGNSMHNLAVLGAEVHAVGAVGEDELGHRLQEMMIDLGIHVDGLFFDPELSTTSKTRILAGDLHTSKQQVIRIDREPDAPVSRHTEEVLVKHLEGLKADVKGLLVSDYGYNIVSPDTTGQILAQYVDHVTVADSRHRIAEYKGCWLVKPNESEAIAATGTPIRMAEDAERVGRELLDRTGGKSVLLTRGNQGMILFESGAEPDVIPIVGEQDIVDVSGAGDTVVSVALLALAAGATFGEAARLANYAASVVVMKRGAATCTKDELLAAIHREERRRGSHA